MDNRIDKLAELIVSHSINVRSKENVLLNVCGTEAYPLTMKVINKIYEAGGNPYIDIWDPKLRRCIMLNCNEEQMELHGRLELDKIAPMDGYIAIKATANSEEFSDIAADKQRIFSNATARATDNRMNKTRWTSLKYPTDAMAQAAGMSSQAFESFCFDAFLTDYAAMADNMKPLVALMDAAERVHITGPGTDLTFSIGGMKSCGCAGNYNLPDGEVSTAPVLHSVNGYIRYNIPSNYRGMTFNNVYLEFKDGKIVAASANNSNKLNEILDTDQGARYIGEFALGVNTRITKPINDILFDEKISGSFHFTPGQCYESPNNGNNSLIHWDLVCIQTEEYGGGEMYFDDMLIRKNGLFVPDMLKCLNPQ